MCVCVCTTVWMHYMNTIENMRKKTRRELHETGRERLVKETEEVLSGSLNMNMAQCS